MNLFELFGFFLLGSVFNALIMLLFVNGVTRSISKSFIGGVESVKKLIEGVKGGQ